MENKPKGRILVVDDMSSWRELVVEILQDDGHDVLAADTAGRAKELLEAHHFDIAVLDMRLVDNEPYNIQGMEVLRQAKTLEPPIKAIILTGYPDPDQEAKAIDSYKADGYYSKAPKGKAFDVDGFSQLIFNMLSAK